jgi:hypothetical protein
LLRKAFSFISFRLSFECYHLDISSLSILSLYKRLGVVYLDKGVVYLYKGVVNIITMLYNEIVVKAHHRRFTMYIVKWHIKGNPYDVKTSVMTLIEFYELCDRNDVIIESHSRV